MSEPTRKTKRFKYPVLKVIVDGIPHNTEDWSLGGLSVANYGGELVKGKEVTIFLGETTYSKPFRIPCDVVRKSGATLALKFKRMEPAQEAELFEFLRLMATRQPLQTR